MNGCSNDISLVIILPTQKLEKGWVAVWVTVKVSVRLMEGGRLMVGQDGTHHWVRPARVSAVMCQ